MREHFNYLFVAEPVAKCRHGAFETRIERVFQHLSTLADNLVQEAVRMVPSMPVAIQRRRRQGVIGLPNMPVRLTFASRSMTDSTI